MFAETRVETEEPRKIDSVSDLRLPASTAPVCMRPFSSARRYVRERLGIPSPNARVDPALFPEADYLVYCMRCGYDLRGLPNEQCPECGERFERGRLLVEQYVRGKRPRSDGRYRFARRLGRFGWVLIVGAIIVRSSIGVAIKLWNDEVFELMMRAGDLLIRALFTILGIELFGCACVGLSSILWLTTLPPITKRRAVKKALRAAQRHPSLRSSDTPRRTDVR
jgi:hypothetical protein